MFYAWEFYSFQTIIYEPIFHRLNARDKSCNKWWIFYILLCTKPHESEANKKSDLIFFFFCCSQKWRLLPLGAQTKLINNEAKKLDRSSGSSRASPTRNSARRPFLSLKLKLEARRLTSPAHREYGSYEIEIELIEYFSWNRIRPISERIFAQIFVRKKW
jgi:hypothetical protein